ncbi:ead/Ea22-like family protein [Salmonella enterica subsp. enterica serovar Stanley]|nr:ead/Ea22-like family protein [Salmonella enterica subsp. enterica serovar Stanley]
MTIDKQALREVAEKATKGPWKVFSDIDTKTFSIHTPRDKRCENVIKWGGFDCQPNAEANAEFIAAFNPKVALALPDELEHYKSREERVTKLVLDNSTSWDALYKKLEAAERRIAEQSAIVAAAEKLVRCKGRYHSELNYQALAKLFGVITPDLPPLVHENVHYADAAEVEITALRQRIQELEAKLETADRLQDGAFRDGLKAGFSYGQTDDQSGFTQCMSAYSPHAGIKVNGE